MDKRSIYGPLPRKDNLSRFEIDGTEIFLSPMNFGYFIQFGNEEFIVSSERLYDRLKPIKYRR